MKAIESYSLFYRPEDDSGSIHLALADGTAADIFIDSASEASFLYDFLRHEKECYYDVATGQFSSGIDFTGAEGKTVSEGK